MYIKPAYEPFRVIEFQESFGGLHMHSVIHIDIPMGEITYQVYKWHPQMPAMTGMKTETLWGREETFEIDVPAIVMRNGKTDFKPIVLQDEQAISEVIFEYGIKLTESGKRKLHKYCNVLDFEPYRNKEMSRKDPGYCGYRDEVNLYFIGITDSYLPKMEWSMRYYYDKEHMWPSEKLYRYILNAYLVNEKTKGWISSYGAFSCLF